MKLFYPIQKEMYENSIEQGVFSSSENWILFFSANQILKSEMNQQGWIEVDSSQVDIKIENDFSIYVKNKIPVSKITFHEQLTFDPCVHILMNTSMVNEPWCFPVLKKYIHSDDRVCVVALSFFDDTKNESDWNKQYAPGQGIWYHSNTDVFFKYGISKDQITWINYFRDSYQDMQAKIRQSSIVLLTGGAPDLMMKRIKECRLSALLKNYKGVMIGYSAGAMIQLKEYHITPDEDYPEFMYKNGLGCIDSLDVEVHYRASKIQNKSIEIVQSEKKKPIYALYEDGGLIYMDKKIELFGHVDIFE